MGLVQYEKFVTVVKVKCPNIPAKKRYFELTIPNIHKEN